MEAIKQIVLAMANAMMAGNTPPDNMETFFPDANDLDNGALDIEYDKKYYRVKVIYVGDVE